MRERLERIRRAYEPGDWWRAPLLALLLAGAWLLRRVLPGEGAAIDDRDPDQVNPHEVEPIERAYAELGRIALEASAARSRYRQAQDASQAALARTDWDDARARARVVARLIRNHPNYGGERCRKSDTATC